LWEELRAGRFFGYAFRRQVPFGRFVADFACHEVRLIVEVDGPSHVTLEGQSRDATRDLLLELEGYTVLRVRNDEVVESIEGVLHVIGQLLPRYESDLAPLDTPLPVPPPQGGRGR
jgi:very-short-patch-repair endonuclease